MNSNDMLDEGCFGSPDFGVVVDPELPGDGLWTVPMFGFDGRGNAHPGWMNPTGYRRVVLVQPAGGSAWVGVFPAGSFRGTDSIAFTPDPRQLVVVTQGRPYIVLAAHTEQGAVVVPHHVRSVVTAPAAELLLLVSYTRMVALGKAGILWESPDLCLDDLGVLSSTALELSCFGYFMEGIREFSVDASTGEPEDGSL